MKDAGCTIREMSWDEKVRWANALTNIPKEKAEEIKKGGLPGEVIFAFIKNLQDEGVKFPRDWTAK